MAELRFDGLVMTTSAAFLGKETLSAYAAAKGAIVGLTRTLAVEGSRHASG